QCRHRRCRNPDEERCLRRAPRLRVRACPRPPVLGTARRLRRGAGHPRRGRADFRLMAGPDRTMLPLVLRNVTVERVTRLNPRTLRVRVTGPELAEFERDGIRLPAFTSPGFDDHVKLIFSTGGDLTEALPVQREHGIDWPRCDHRAGRDYTVRSFDPLAGTAD